MNKIIFITILIFIIIVLNYFIIFNYDELIAKRFLILSLGCFFGIIIMTFYNNDDDDNFPFNFI